MVWSAAYINAAILQDSYTVGTLQPNSRLYFLQDANWNTTAAVGLINVGWQVLQYYVYSPYGTITVLNEDGAGSTPIVNNLYQGMTLDPVTGLYYARNRNYSPTLGRWINQDPAGYINGANTYQFVMSNPVNGLDPMGLWHWYNPWTWNWSWLPWVPKVVVDTAKQVPPGGEFCGAVEALGNLPKAGGLANFREEYDYSHNINPDTDPLYTGLRKLSEGLPLTIQEHNAIANAMK
jgi:RHS repeat-associated protein